MGKKKSKKKSNKKIKKNNPQNSSNKKDSSPNTPEVEIAPQDTSAVEDVLSKIGDMAAKGFAIAKESIVNVGIESIKLASELEEVQGNFDKNSDSLAKQMETAKANMENLKLEIGKALLPLAKEAVKAFNEVGGKLIEAFQSEEVQSSIKNISEKLGELIKKVSEVIIEWIPKIIEGFSWILDHASEIAAGIASIGAALVVFKTVSFILTLVEAFKTAAKVTKGLTVAQWLYNAAMAACGGPIGLIIGVIAALIAGIVVLWNTNEGFRDAIIGVWEAIGEIASEVWGAICTFFTETIPEAWNSFAAFFTETVPQFFLSLWNTICEVCSVGWQLIADFFTVTIPLWIQSIIDWFNQLPEQIGYVMGYILGNIIQFGMNCWNWITVDLPAIIAGIINWFAQLPEQILIWLVQVVTNIIQWGSDIYNSSMEWIGNTINSIINWFAQLPGRIWESLCNVVSSIGSWGYNMLQSGITAATDLVNSVVEIVTSLPEKMLEIGKNIVKGIYNGIIGAKDWLFDKIGSFCDGVISGFMGGFDEHSPSRIMRDLVGVNIVKGIGVGIELESPNLDKDINANISDLTARMKSTVDYETARTTASVVAYNNGKLGNTSVNDEVNKKGNTPFVVNANLIVDGKEFTQTVVAPHQAILEEYYEGR